MYAETPIQHTPLQSIGLACLSFPALEEEMSKICPAVFAFQHLRFPILPSHLRYQSLKSLPAISNLHVQLKSNTHYG